MGNEREANPPNVLVVLTEAQNYRSIDMATEFTKITPNIVKLAERGLVFENAFSSAQESNDASKKEIKAANFQRRQRLAGLTAPKRRGLPELDTLFRVAQEHGYACARLDEERCAESSSKRRYFGEDTRRLKGFTDSRNSYSSQEHREGPPQRDVKAVNALLTRQVEAHIDEAFRDGRPFLTVCTYKSPQGAEVWTYDPAIATEDVTLPQNYQRPPSTLPAGLSHSIARSRFEENMCQDQIPSETSLREFIAHYSGYVASIDGYVGHLGQKLRLLGCERDTIVVFSSLQGELLGAHGLLSDAGVFWDAACKVPLIFNYPKQLTAGNRSSALTTTADIVPTLADLLSLTKGTAFGGKSLRRIADYQIGLTEEIYFQDWERHGQSNPTFAIRNKRWKFIWWPNGQDELYDITQDPFELHNLADKRAFADVIREQRSHIFQHLQQSSELSEGQLSLINAAFVASL